MKVLKKDLEIYKDMYKYHYKLLDILIRYSLTLIQENVNDNYVNNVILDVKKILILTDKLLINKENCFNVFFNENEKHTLINNSERSKKIKEYYDLLANVLLNMK